MSELLASLEQAHSTSQARPDDTAEAEASAETEAVASDEFKEAAAAPEELAAPSKRTDKKRKKGGHTLTATQPRHVDHHTASEKPAATEEPLQPRVIAAAYGGAPGAQQPTSQEAGLAQGWSEAGLAAVSGLTAAAAAPVSTGDPTPRAGPTIDARHLLFNLSALQVPHRAQWHP
jgi:hypothetical protein